MNTKNLDTFITVTKYNSINAAADALWGPRHGEPPSRLCSNRSTVWKPMSASNFLSAALPESA